MSDRGVIKNEARAKQINDFSGLRFERGITPTDIDGLIDFNNEQLVIFEVKYEGTPLPNGQRMALERLRNAAEKGGLDAWLIVAEHNVSDPDVAIDVSLATVREIANSQSKSLRPVNRTGTVRQVIDWIKAHKGVQ